MPLSRARLRYLDDEDAWSEVRTDKIDVLTLLVDNPHMGYRPTEITAETSVPEAELGTILGEFCADGFVETIGDYYLVNQDRVDEIRDILLTSRQFAAIAPIRSPSAAPADCDESAKDTGPEIDLSQPAPSSSDVFSED